MKHFILVLLLCIGNQIRVNFIGEFTLSDLFMVGYCLLTIFPQFRSKIGKDKELVYVMKLYIYLLIVQIFMELIIANEYVKMVKGFAITIFSLTKFLFIWCLLKKDNRCIAYFFLCTTVVSFFSLENTEGVTQAEILEGSSSTAFSFFKFRIAPMIGTSLVIISLLIPKIRCHIWAIAAGLICIVLGARSTGLMIFLTGVIVYFVNSNKRINGKKVLRYTLLFSIIGYGLFVVYVNAVLSGTITSGNSATQFKTVENPYNPIYILLSGRAEVPSSIAAIIDEPITGHGAWPEDPDFKYHKIMLAFQNKQFERFADSNEWLIPSHSVVFQSGVHNGVIAMVLMIMILMFFIKRGFKSFDKRNVFLYATVFCLMQLIWNGLFSPLSHFRGMFPLYFTVCLYSYKYKNYLLTNRNDSNGK